MNLVVNDKPCEAGVGQTIGKAARVNHSHVGYVCGGHGVCQACYVTVQEGAEHLGPLSDIEKAFLSPRQIAAGGRLACQATIAYDGTVKVLSRPEEVRRLLFSNPPALFPYGARMGQDALQQIVPGVTNLAGRIQRGEMGGREALGDLVEAAGAAVKLAVETMPQMIPFREQLSGILSVLPVKLPFMSPRSVPAKIERISVNAGSSGV